MDLAPEAAFPRAFAAAALACAIAFPAITLGLVRYPSPGVAAVTDLYRTKEGIAARAAARGGRRVFLVAGSSGAHGFDAELLSARLGLPCVNFATHAGLGMAYLLDRARRVLRKGDVAVTALEYHLFWDTAWPFRDVEWKSFATSDKRRFFELGLSTSARALLTVPARDYPGFLAALLPPRLGGPERAGYDPAALSPAGDYRLLPPRAPVSRLTPELPPDTRAGSYPAFRSFAAWCRESGVTLLVTWPNLGVATPETEARFATLPASIRRWFEEAGASVLDEPGDSFLPEGWFTDTAYHVAFGGRRLRSERLARLLAPRLGLPPLPSPASLYVTTPRGGPVTRLNAFGPSDAVGVAALVPEPSWPPEAATAASLAALAARGTPLLFDDPSVEAALLPHGLSGALERTESGDVASFLARFPDHVVLFVRAGEPPSGAAAPAALPPAVRDGVPAGSPGAAAFATGSRRFAPRVSSGPGGARVTLDGDELFPGIGRSRTRVEAVSAPAGGPGTAVTASGIFASGRDLCPGGPGWCLAAFDPVTGLLAGAATFPFDRPATLARLFRAVPAGSGGPAPLVLARFLATGTEAPGVTPEGTAARVAFRSTNSVFASDLRELPASGRLELSVACVPGTGVATVVQTNAPWRFETLAPPAPVACAGAPVPARTFWRLAPGETLADGEWAFAGLAHTGTPSTVTVLSAGVHGDR